MQRTLIVEALKSGKAFEQYLGLRVGQNTQGRQRVLFWEIMTAHVQAICSA